ncbi:dTMP kinase [Longimycelium tulufanense]|uniref:Thymidylate kinase n=1 Tax=Longimycelium tulufanense TaxID=907463 RepID=A0A8J3CC84_9PSEU|nr:dTMP kinase [Longimycelium tulufanense]GGM44987.1 dTMP kinase [Longimycelium tulufanense]
MRSVLAIPAFRRLWFVSALCSIGDWLSFLALSALITKLTDVYLVQSYALSAVVVTQLLPAMLFGPLGGVLADRFDRRKIMVVADLARCGLFLSIALVGELWWVLVANFMIGVCALFWIPAKDSSIPNLLRRRDQVETANQLNVVMTYGGAVIAAAGLFSAVSAVGPTLNLRSELGIANIIVVINGLLFLTSAIVVATRIREISGHGDPARRRASQASTGQPGVFGMLRDGLRFVRATPLVRGLVIGLAGAVAAGGAIISCAKLYSSSLSGGDTAYGMLIVSVFLGLALGMATMPRLARRLPHNRLFGITIVVAALALIVVALAPHLWVALAAVALLGFCAGTAFLTSFTIIGSQVEDAVRGRTNALVQLLIKVILLGSTAVVPLVVGLVRPRTVTIFGEPMQIDGTRPVLLAAGVVAAVVGVVAYRQMDDRRSEPILSDLLAAIRGGDRLRRGGGGMLIAIEGDTVDDTATQAARLAEWLRVGGRDVVLAGDPALDESRLRGVLDGASLSGARAHALVAAAVRADVVERRVRPALASGALVVMERYVDSPLAHLGASGGLEPADLESLADWATGQLRPDVTVLLDRDPASLGTPPDSGGFGSMEHHWRVQRILTEMAASDPDRYVVVDADGTEDEVAERVRAAVLPVLAQRWLAVPGGSTPLAGAEAP